MPCHFSRAIRNVPIPLVCLLAFWLCGQGLFARTVSLSFNATAAGAILHIEGTANLPDHTVIEWELRHEFLFQSTGLPIERLAAEGHTIVLHHRFEADVSLRGWPKGNIEVWVAFQPVSFGTPQPRVVTSLYGVYGEHLQGDNVSAVGGLKNMHRVEKKEYVTFDGGREARSENRGRGRRPQS